MNLRHIEIFHAVYVNGSVSGAARTLNISQPSVSKTLRHAESLLGFPLFQRTAGRLVPTEDAHILFTEVREIQDRVYALREAGRNLRRATGGTLRLSALPSLALDALPTAVSRFLRAHPNVKFDLQTVHHDDLLRKLYERETDVAIAYEVPPAAPLGNRWLGEGELVVLYREQDMPDAPPRLELECLRGRRFITVAARLNHATTRRSPRCQTKVRAVRFACAWSALVLSHSSSVGSPLAKDERSCWLVSASEMNAVIAGRIVAHASQRPALR